MGKKYVCAVCAGVKAGVFGHTDGNIESGFASVFMIGAGYGVALSRMKDATIMNKHIDGMCEDHRSAFAETVLMTSMQDMSKLREEEAAS